MKVVVCGGGIGGQALALSLHAAGIEAEVFEAAPEIKELGVGINVLPHAVRELAELGLSDQLAATGVATSELLMFNRHGQLIWREPAGLAEGYNWPQYSIHRGRLLGLLYRASLERLGPDHVRTDHRVVSHEQTDEGASVTFADGSSAEGDLVVGADGLDSAIRAQLYPDEGDPLWNGVTMWRGIALARPPVSPTSMMLVGRKGRRAVLYPLSAPDDEGRVEVNMVLDGQTGEAHAMPKQDWHHEVHRSEVIDLFGGMRYDWLDLGSLIETAEQWWKYPMVDRDPVERWSFGRVTLLGDAAHPMYPVGSNGASQAIVDARTLAHALATEDDLGTALAKYEDARRPATAGVVQANRELLAVRCMELAEERAPDGFDRPEDIFAPGELEELSSEFKRIAGFDPAELNERPSLSV